MSEKSSENSAKWQAVASAGERVVRICDDWHGQGWECGQWLPKNWAKNVGLGGQRCGRAPSSPFFGGFSLYCKTAEPSQPLIFFWLNLIRLGTHMAIHILHKRAWEGQYVCKSIGNLLRKEAGRLFSWRTDCYKVCFQCPPTHTNPNVLLKILKILNRAQVVLHELHFLRRQFNVMKVE